MYAVNPKTQRTSKSCENHDTLSHFCLKRSFCPGARANLTSIPDPPPQPGSGTMLRPWLVPHPLEACGGTSEAAGQPPAARGWGSVSRPGVHLPTSTVFLKVRGRPAFRQ